MNPTSKSTASSSTDDIKPASEPQPQKANIWTNVQSQQRPLNLPCGDLIGNRVDYISVCVPLYNASIKGDWKAAEAILNQKPELVRFGINENYDTALHIAVSAKSNKSVENFVKNLVNRMTDDDLELRNKNSNTALCLASAGGNVEIVKIMVNKHRALLDMPGSQNMMPLYMACLFGQREMVKYLYDNSNKMAGDFWTYQNRGWVLQKCVEADLFDIALKIVTDWEELATSGSVLGTLARKTDACKKIEPHFMWKFICQGFGIMYVKIGPTDKQSDAMRLLEIIWKNIMRLSKNEIDVIIRGPCEKKNGVPKFPSRVLFVAAKMGNVEFLVELIRQNPDLIWKTNDNNKSIFHVGVSYRHEDIYNLLYEMGSMKDMITPLKNEKGNNMLHLVGNMPKTKHLGYASGVALQMQRELLWFKEVEAMIPPSYRERKNKDGLTPHELFTKEHKDLFSAGEKWMKDTASQCTVVAALIATIAFAAAFTVPGGYNQDSGIPIFLHKRSLLVFAIADALSLTFSSISILIFLSIHIASYFEHDFLEKLPKKLIKGLGTLFFSIAAMMVAFGASFFIIYKNNLIWVPVIVSLFASIPVILYARLQYDLLRDFYRSTYDSKNLFKPKEPKLHLPNPQF